MRINDDDDDDDDDDDIIMWTIIDNATVTAAYPYNQQSTNQREREQRKLF